MINYILLYYFFFLFFSYCIFSVSRSNKYIEYLFKYFSFCLMNKKKYKQDKQEIHANNILKMLMKFKIFLKFNVKIFNFLLK